MSKIDHSNSPFQGLSKAHKIALWFLIIIALAIVIFWIWQIKNQLNTPFNYQPSAQEKANSLGANNEATSTAAINLLKETDTDGDGLSDYAELYIYHTSPYLADSDSDGISDLKEIEQGTNPNCPLGKTCNGEGSNSNVSTSTIPSFSQAPSLTNTINNTKITKSNSVVSTSTLNKTALQKVLSGQADAATLRQVLISSGVASAAQLKNISDQELLQSYKQTLANGHYASSSLKTNK